VLVAALNPNSKQYPMAGNCVKKIYYFYQTLLQGDSWLFQIATGFACGTLCLMRPDKTTDIPIFNIFFLDRDANCINFTTLKQTNEKTFTSTFTGLH